MGTRINYFVVLTRGTLRETFATKGAAHQAPQDLLDPLAAAASPTYTSGNRMDLLGCLYETVDRRARFKRLSACWRITNFSAQWRTAWSHARFGCCRFLVVHPRDSPSAFPTDSGNSWRPYRSDSWAAYAPAAAIPKKHPAQGGFALDGWLSVTRATVLRPSARLHRGGYRSPIPLAPSSPTVYPCHANNLVTDLRASRNLGIPAAYIHNI